MSASRSGHHGSALLHHPVLGTAATLICLLLATAAAQ
jgi:hypothetical protein